MIHIKVKVPKITTGKFSYSCLNKNSGIVRKRVNPIIVYRQIEAKVNRLYACNPNIKINVLVDYLHGYRNEAEYAGKAAVRFSMYALICFLEDYLPEGFYNKRVKKYIPNNNFDKREDV